MQWTITYYNEKVEKHVLALPKKLLARYFRMTDTMIKYGPHLGMPHTRSLGNGLLELRLKASEGIARVFYCCIVGHRIMLLHSIVKKQQKTPLNDLRLAKQRMKEVSEHD